MCELVTRLEAENACVECKALLDIIDFDHHVTQAEIASFESAHMRGRIERLADPVLAIKELELIACRIAATDQALHMSLRALVRLMHNGLAVDCLEAVSEFF